MYSLIRPLLGFVVVLALVTPSTGCKGDSKATARLPDTPKQPPPTDSDKKPPPTQAELGREQQKPSR